MRPSSAVLEAQDRRRATLLAGVLFLFIVLGASSGLVQLAFIPDFFGTFLAMSSALVVLVGLYGVARTRWYRLSAALSALVVIAACVGAVVQNPSDPVWFAFMNAGVLLAAVLLRTRSSAVIALASVVGVGAAVALVPELRDTGRILPILAFQAVFSVLLVGSFGYWRRQAEANVEVLRRDAHSATLLRALEEAAVAIGEADSRDAIYQALGSTLLRLGYTTTVLQLDPGTPNLEVLFYSAPSRLLSRAEALAGIRLHEFRVPADATPFHRSVLAGDTVYVTDVVALTATTLPRLVAAAARPLVGLLGMARIVGAPLATRADGAVDGMVVVASNGLQESDCPAISQFARQISARLRSEGLVRRLAATNRALRVLTQASRSIADATSQTALLQSVCDIAVEEGGYRYATARLVTRPAAEGVIGSGQPPAETDGVVESALSRALGGEVAREDDVIALPLVDDDVVFGALALWSNDNEALPGEEVQLLADLADAVSFGLSALRTELARQHVEGERQALFEQLTQAQKMEVVGHVAGGVAHDFNNLLTVILANTELALAEAAAADDVELGETLESVAFAARRAAALVQQLLLFSRPSTAAARGVDLVELLRGLHALLRRLVREDIDVSFESPERPVWVHGDPSQLEQIVVNLVVNARDAVQRGGRIRVALEVADDAAVLRVSDDGHGMPPDVQDKVFDAFFTTKPHGTGTGLGLATVQRLVERHAGTIAVDSTQGRGTVMTVRLPLGSPPPVPEVIRESPPTPSTGGTVLVCEDEDAVRAVACRILREAGYTVIESATAEEALHTAEHRGPIHVLLTDLVLPGMSGTELAAALRERGDSVGVVFVSGYAPEEVLAGALVDAAAVVAKPFSSRDLLDRIAAAR